MSFDVSDLLNAYTIGIFPMADDSGEIHWYAPNPRAIIPIENYEPSKSLRPILNQQKFEVRINCDFEQVMRNCAKPRFTGDSTWISEEIIHMYTELHHLGFAHSVEAYQDGELAGGLYGVAIGGAYFGESMFHLKPNASKVAFHFLIDILKKNAYQLLDTQFINDNVKRFGAIEVPRNFYEKKLRDALTKECHFRLNPE
jgi:leucyl/phenylalanyl-tRNA--protein transferase